MKWNPKCNNWQKKKVRRYWGQNIITFCYYILGFYYISFYYTSGCCYKSGSNKAHQSESLFGFSWYSEIQTNLLTSISKVSECDQVVPGVTLVLIYHENKTYRGPRMEPWGTPQRRIFNTYWEFYWYSNCYFCLLVKE